jgi:hypothetical protein
MAVLRHGPNRVAAGAHQDAGTAVVGSDHQRHLHVVFHPAVRRRRRAVAAQPRRLGRVRAAVRRAVVRRARRLRGDARGTAVGGGALYPGRNCRRPVYPTLHVQKRGRCSGRRTAGRDAPKPARRKPIRRADLHPRLGNAASAVRRGAAQLRAGQCESRGGHPFPARRVDRDDLDLLVAPGQTRMASTPGRLPLGDGLHAGVCRRTLRGRHSAGLGAGRVGVADHGPSRLVVVTPSCVDVSPLRRG